MRWGRYSILLMAALIWCFAIVFFPWLLRSGYPNVAVVISIFFSKLCHQVTARSFGMGGLTFPVCSRCFALYMGALAGILISPIFKLLNFSTRLVQLLLLAGSSLTALDISLDMLNLLSNTFFTRTITGSILGLSIGLMVALAIQGVEFEWKIAKPLDAH
jgi:uncharacterized membrane protein